MAIEGVVRRRIQELIRSAHQLVGFGETLENIDHDDLAKCRAWLASAQNLIHLVVENPLKPYRTATDILTMASDAKVPQNVRNFSAILQTLLIDADAGLLSTVADQARAGIFDDFLDHAQHYLAAKRKNEAGAIAGVVFEDSLRRICAKVGIPEKDQQLDALISELVKRSELTEAKAKRARAAAHVRTKATHAQWDEFELEDVRATIDFTRELVESKLT